MKNSDTNKSGFIKKASGAAIAFLLAATLVATPSYAKSKKVDWGKIGENILTNTVNNTIDRASRNTRKGVQNKGNDRRKAYGNGVLGTIIGDVDKQLEKEGNSILKDIFNQGKMK